MIRLEDVHVRLGQREVLRGVTASLTERRVGVVGANGSGKSTLARLINGLVLPSSGTVIRHARSPRVIGVAMPGGIVARINASSRSSVRAAHAIRRGPVASAALLSAALSASA